VRLDYFGRSERYVVTDLAHVLRVGLSLVKDTFKLALRLRQLEKEGVVKADPSYGQGRP